MGRKGVGFGMNSRDGFENDCILYFLSFGLISAKDIIAKLQRPKPIKY
jgi:hypothetical protein